MLKRMWSRLWCSCALSRLSSFVVHLVAKPCCRVACLATYWKVQSWQVAEKAAHHQSTNCTNRWTSNKCNKYQTISAFIFLLKIIQLSSSWQRGGQQPKIRKEGGGKQSNADKRREGPTWEKHETTVYTFDKSDHYSRLNFSLLFWISPYRCTGRPHF